MEMKEFSMEARLLIAFLLMGVVLLVSQYFYSPVPTPVAGKTDAKAADQTKAPDPVKVPAAAPLPPEKPTPPPAALSGQIQADREETITVETEVHRVVFSNRGAVVRSWVLKGYKDQAGKPLDLVYAKGLERAPAPFSAAIKNQTLPTDPNTALFRVERPDNGLSLSFAYSDGRAETTKSFKFQPKGYLVDITSEINFNGVRVPHSLVWRGGFGDSTVFNPAAQAHSVYYDLANSKLTQNDVKVAKDGPVSVSGQYSFAGLDDHYFAGVFLPVSRAPIELTTYLDNVPDNKDGKDEQRVGAGVGGDGLNRFAFFAGPKDIEILRRVDPKLEGLIDWGTWFGFIAKPLFLALNWTAEHLTKNYGWAIVLITIAMNLALFPLRLSSMKSAKKMQALKPQIDAINEKVKGLPMKDPRRAEIQQQQLELYKKHGVNPMGGCLPMALQIPVLVAFYTVLSVSINMRGASWLWIKDLSQAEPYYILVILLVVTQFLQQKMTPNPGMDPAQQKIMLFMPLLFGYMFYLQAAGLVLYWLTGNLVGIASQWLLNRFTPAPAAAPVTPPPKKKRN
jgi:YidC/Oxa1 family membrane protein insertase